MRPCMTHLAFHAADLDDMVGFYQDYCEMEVVHQRGQGEDRVVWLAETGRRQELVFVLIGGGREKHVVDNDYGHIGFALESREAVDTIADRAREAGILEWEPRQEAYPVGYYCALKDPNGNFVEFSFGQPLGPGAPEEIGFGRNAVES
jgi:catechol 2,3-dioxygenase-like lactoylglutathione lyase family enzyme